MIQQMHEQHVELGGCGRKLYLVSRASTHGIYSLKYIGSLLSYNLCKKILISDPLNL